MVKKVVERVSAVIKKMDAHPEWARDRDRITDEQRQEKLDRAIAAAATPRSGRY